MHRSGTCTYNIYVLSHKYAVHSIRFYVLPVVVQEYNFSNKHGVLRRKVASSPVSPSHEHTLFLVLCTRRKVSLVYVREITCIILHCQD